MDEFYKPLTYEEWAESIQFIGLDKKIGRNVWNACKSQITKIINSPNCYFSCDRERILDEMKKI